MIDITHTTLNYSKLEEFPICIHANSNLHLVSSKYLILDLEDGRIIADMLKAQTTTSASKSNNLNR